MSTYTEIASDEVIQKTIAALASNNIAAEVVGDLTAAKDFVLKNIPDGARVFTTTSATLQEAGLDEVLNKAPYHSVRNEFLALYGQADKALQMRQIGAASDVTVGSAHAITQDGHLLFASRTGSQIPNLAYGAGKIILVVSAKKLVKDLAGGIQRIKEHIVPLEDARALKAYGSHTKFNKLLVVNSEDTPGQITVVIVKQDVGF